MPAFPEDESSTILSAVSRPSRSASSIMRRTGRSFTDPPGLNHSAFARISTRGGIPRRRFTRSSGVLPIRSRRPLDTLVVKQDGGFRVAAPPVCEQPRVDQVVEDGILLLSRPTAAQDIQRKVHPEGPIRDDVAGDPGGQLLRQGGQVQDLFLRKA